MWLLYDTKGIMQFVIELYTKQIYILWIKEPQTKFAISWNFEFFPNTNNKPVHLRFLLYK